MRFTQKGAGLPVEVSGSCSVVVDAIKFYARSNFIYCCCGLLRYLKDKITFYPPPPSISLLSALPQFWFTCRNRVPTKRASLETGSRTREAVLSGRVNFWFACQISRKKVIDMSTVRNANNPNFEFSFSLYVFSDCLWFPVDTLGPLFFCYFINMNYLKLFALFLWSKVIIWQTFWITTYISKQRGSCFITVITFSQTNPKVSLKKNV